MMKLLTRALLKRLPQYAEIANDPDPMVQCKFFYPDFHWTWYVIAFDGKDTFYGLVDGDVAELGDFSLRELLTTQGKWGLPIEREMHFIPCLLSDLCDELGLREDEL